MIEITKWESARCYDLLDKDQVGMYDIAYCGESLVDERSSWVDGYLKKVAHSIMPVEFSYHESLLTLGSSTSSIADLYKPSIPTENRVLIDATTLAFPELLYLFIMLNANMIGFDVLYVQPEEYGGSRKADSGEIVPIQLSVDGLGPKILAPYVQPSRNATMLVFLGFEGHRLGSIFNSDIFGVPEYYCLVGIPGFKAGWENKAIYNNMSYLSGIGTDLRDILISGANDPVYTYERITEQYEALKYHEKSLFLAPFGTKPAGIAAANFAVNNTQNLGVVYDFIQNKTGRSTGMDMAHKWTFSFFSPESG